MAIELYFSRNETNTQWGFRLAGGAEYNTPITVIKVFENSIAENAGLQVNDVVVRINNTPMAGMTHTECHKLLSVSGNQLILAIRRGDITPATPEIENDEEVMTIFQQSLQKEEKKVRFESVTEEEEEQDLPNDKSPILEKGVSPIILTTITPKQQEKKWSTFLQKPKNPPPKIKKTDEIPKGEPYKVVIVKQKKKTKEDISQKDTATVQDNTDDNKNNNIAPETENNEQVEFEEVFENISEPSFEEEINETEFDQPEKEKELDENEMDEKQSATQKFLEERLAAVQKQLEVLSQLPSTIQLTLDAVTKELATIVKAKEKVDQGLELLPEDLEIKEEKQEETDDEDTNAEHETSDRNSEVNSETNNGGLGEDNEAFQANLSDEDIIVDTPEHEENFESSLVEDLEIAAEIMKPPEPEPNPYEGLTDEEKEAKLIERQRIKKQQKVEEQYQLEEKSDVPLKPIDRPIILPGGRRWSQPDDVCPVRHPKMTDAKIASTIETYSEVITGKLKGESNCRMVPSRIASENKINFLKYTPPPKNLEYLQRSEVYKLVHDLEPPVRGICNRAEKVLSERDYYEKDQIETQ